MLSRSALLTDSHPIDGLSNTGTSPTNSDTALTNAPPQPTGGAFPPHHVGTINAAFIGIFSAAQHPRRLRNRYDHGTYVPTYDDKGNIVWVRLL